MNNILNIKDDAFSFKCPNCRQYISSDLNECRFCKTVLLSETKRFAIEREKKETRQYRFKNHLKHFLIGIVVFPLAIAINIYILWEMFSGASSVVIVFYSLVLYGFSELCYGTYGFIQDALDKAKNV